MLKKLRYYVPYKTAFLLVSGICLLVYATVQQDQRQTANDPQIQLAQDSAALLRAGSQPNFSNQTIDIAKSLRPYLVIFDSQRNPVSSDALLDGNIPTLPAGVFATAKRKGEYRFTWQPRPGVRQALVLIPVNNDASQFVAAGRSLKEVEKREQRTFQMTAITWILMLAVSFAGISFSRRKA